jgi:hypothetical protein
MVAINKDATRAFYYSYTPYLQPTPSLGTGSRITGSIALGTRPKIGGITRIYNFFKTYNQEEAFKNQLVFNIYGYRK